MKLIDADVLTDGRVENDPVVIAAKCADTIELDRSWWKGCKFCIGDFEGYTPRFRDVNGKQRPLFIPEGKAKIVLNGSYNRDYDIPIKYCPHCGRPLTEEAWAELERRINDGTTDN